MDRGAGLDIVADQPRMSGLPRMTHQRVKELCGSQSSSATRRPSLAAWTARAVVIVLFPEPPFVEATATVIGVCFTVSASFILLRESNFLVLRLVLHDFSEKVRRKRLSCSVYRLKTLTIWDVA
jgi:hypothetical protein